jgi:hypothetical protein
LSAITAPSDRSSSRASEDQLPWGFEQFFGKWDQLIRRQSAMTLVHRLGQRVRYPGTQPDHGGLFDAELHCDRVGALETNPSDVSGKPIGVLGHDLHSLGPVGLEDANRAGGSDSIAVKKDHDLPDDLLLGPSVRDPFGSDRADARHLAKPIGLRLDDVEDLFAEGPNHLLGVDKPDAPDHPGAKIFLDPVN